MTEANIIKEIELKMKELSTQNLKSKTAIIQQLYPFIYEAVNKGYSQIFIHQTLSDNGLNMKLGSYRTALHRIKKGLENGNRKPLALPTAIDTEIESTASATQIASSLQKSVSVGNQDYSKIAKTKLKSDKKRK